MSSDLKEISEVNDLQNGTESATISFGLDTALSDKIKVENVHALL